MAVTLLFAVWHIGYFDSILLNMEINHLTGSIVFVVSMKVITGLIFGVATGFLRYKQKALTPEFWLTVS